MTNEEDCSTFACHISHLAQTSLLKLNVADGQPLVDHQNLRFQMRRHRKRQAHIHSGRITLYGRVDELLQFGERDYFVELASYFGLRRSEERRVGKECRS